MSSLLNPPQPGQAVERGTQSATHSYRLPTMSKAPRADTQALRAPVSEAAPIAALLQSAVPSSGPGSGVPSAPTCHSALVGSRFSLLAHASSAWNQVANPDGVTDGKLKAKM